jgi:hypothetical protein
VVRAAQIFYERELPVNGLTYPLIPVVEHDRTRAGPAGKPPWRTS